MADEGSQYLASQSAMSIGAYGQIRIAMQIVGICTPQKVLISKTRKFIDVL